MQRSNVNVKKIESNVQGREYENRAVGLYCIKSPALGVGTLSDLLPLLLSGALEDGGGSIAEPATAESNAVLKGAILKLPPPSSLIFRSVASRASRADVKSEFIGWQKLSRTRFPCSIKTKPTKTKHENHSPMDIR